MKIDKLLYGVAYYDEYMPLDRLDEDIKLMQAANINVIRIAESTWATEEPQNGVFDFSHVERVLQATVNTGIRVIVGTPTYAVPPWLAAEHPEVLAITERGHGKYGARQIMDITSPAYLFYGERVIHRLLECVQKYPHVIGFQIDNETKHYNTAGPNVLKRFNSYLRMKFGSIEELNREFGFNYWSNRIDSWENVPDPTGAINGSYRAEFDKFRRQLVTDFLNWQSSIIKEYIRDGQFITHNFDFAWRGFSYGIQPAVDHKQASACLDIAGCDIYHPTQSNLTGKEIAFGGDLIRSLKQDNYLVLETEAQGHISWTPYDGQLRLHAFSHLASGASSVMYWHWHSIHNSFETYWKGLLSHDLKPNRPYYEAVTIGADFQKLSPIINKMKKKNRIALLVSNESLTGLEQFPIPSGFPSANVEVDYNDIVRLYYDALYEQNLECDIIFPIDYVRFSDYDLLVVPVLYSAERKVINALNSFVEHGGHILMSFRSVFSNEFLTVRHEQQPAGLSDCFGIRYDEFTEPIDVKLTDETFKLDPEALTASVFMELVEPVDADVLAYYDHKFWGKYAAVTRNSYGAGTATYVACLTTAACTREIMKLVAQTADVWGCEQQAAFPIIIRNGTTVDDRRVHFYFNYSDEAVKQRYLHLDGISLLDDQQINENDDMDFAPWTCKIILEKA